MSIFFLIVEVFLYCFAFYIIRKKDELGIIYLPVLFFAYAVITPILPIGLFYGVITLLVFLLIRKNALIIKENIYASILFIYFLVLLTGAKSDIKLGPVYSVLTFFICLPLINLIYRKHSHDVVFKELINAALIILLLFIANTICSSIAGYAPSSMYGITSGVLYGNLVTTNFNVIAISLFVVLLKVLKKSNLIIFAIYAVSLAFILLTLRRSVMLASVLGIPFAILATLTQNAVKKVVFFLFISISVGAAVYFNSNFVSSFEERYEMRKLDERDFEEEKRFSEYDAVYTDMFVYKDYSPWFGFGLFNSVGNYGRGSYYERALHADLTSIAHSSGLIGVFLYLLMIFSVLHKAYKASKEKSDKITFLYCFVVFIIYTVTGRFTQADSMLFLFLLINASLAKKEVEGEALQFDNKTVLII